MFGSNPFGQSSSSPFGTQPVFGQSSGATSNPFAPKPFGSPSFGSQSGGSMFGGTSTGVFGAQSSSPMGSTSLFGASSSPASAFGASSGSSAFGQKPAAFGGFGSSSAQTSFGSFPQSQPAFGSNVFGSSSTPFGTPSQPAFVQGSSPSFGGSSTGVFGQTSQTTSQTFGSTSGGFGLSSSPFGTTPTSPFSSTPTQPFGATQTSPFGATPAQPFGTTQTPPFGTTPAQPFGAAQTPLFGSTQTQLPFGSTQTPPPFGSTQTSPFGGGSTPNFNFGTGSGFGQSTTSFGGTTPFGVTSSPQTSAFGTQTTTPSFGQTTFGGAQRPGSRVAPYSPTPETDGAAGAQPGRLESISAMPIYKEKSHEELRWEDYQSGDKGGPSTASQSTAVGAFGTPTSTFSQSSANPFSSSTAANPFGQKTTSSFSTGFGALSTNTFGTTPFGLSNASNPFGSTSSAPPSIFGQTTQPFGLTTSTPAFSTGFGSSPLFGTTAQGSTSTFSGGLFGNTQTATPFSSTPALPQTSSPFPQTQTSSGFGLQTSSGFGLPATGFGQSTVFTAPATPFGSNIFSTSSTLLTTSNTSGFGQSTPSLFQPAQPPQNAPSFALGSFAQSQPTGNTTGFGGTPSIFGQSSFGQAPAAQVNVAAQATQIANPFGTLPAMPQMSIGQQGSSIQYGISSLPQVVEKATPVRISSLLTSRHLSQRRSRLPIRKYHPSTGGAKVPFFTDDEETPSTPKADAFFIPRENPRALVIRPMEQWPSRTTADRSTPSKVTPVHENASNDEESSKEQANNHSEKNQKTKGVHTPEKGDSYITLSGHRAGEAAIVYEHGAGIETLMPKLRHSDYFTEPKIQEIAAKERAEPGFARRVKDFVIGQSGFGSIKFLGETDVRRLDLESIVQFNNREVIVYMDESKKPPIGQGLNKAAEVTLLNIKCFDKKSGQQITEGVRIEKYKEMLRKKAEDQGAEFVSYDAVKGEWKFRVEHFSVYKFGDEDESDEEDLDVIL